MQTTDQLKVGDLVEFMTRKTESVMLVTLTWTSPISEPQFLAIDTNTGKTE